MYGTRSHYEVKDRMKKALVIALAASLILSMGSMGVVAAPANTYSQTAVMAQTRIASNIPLADATTINGLNQEILDSIHMDENSKYVRVGYNTNTRKFQIQVNTNSAVAKTNYLQGLKGTGFKTSLSTFLSKLTNRTLTDYEINNVARTATGAVTTDEIQNAFTAQMQARLRQVAGFLAPITGTMNDLSKVGAIPAKVVFADSNGQKVYVDYVIEFVPANWAV